VELQMRSEARIIRISQLWTLVEVSWTYWRPNSRPFLLRHDVQCRS